MTKGNNEDIKILLVDDEKQFVDTLAERLAMRGFTARVAYDGPQALKAVEEPTDVIVLDLRMPGMDGFEVLRNVKKSNPQVQVIILTGHGGDAEEQTAYRMGAYNFLKKPMDIDELLGSIRMAYRDKLENAMVAVSLAEGGDFDAARDVMAEKDILAEHDK
ncbi:response regulator [uncultured Desulfovibrio sp.]|uniref:response regulator n=1 Tax=uncultured Desulfovibrio sp. TaxID=167968 RepID=UPI001C396DE1|nr:response regulator [uncultured Desulfovibrio sp.]HIX41518.1 response regulator [Candidatus Desulfovibrio intestinigallinarum]